MEKLIIFDADSIIWTIAYKFRNKKLKNMVLVALNKFIDEVIRNTGATHYVGFYGSKEHDRKPNFRYAIDSNYKGQRPAEPDWLVKWRPVIHKEMTDKWGFQPVDGIEADDACSITAHKYLNDYNNVIVATSDKDLLQIPYTTYYNYTKHTSEDITEFEAARYLATQVLTGDSADNIKGLYKVGPVKAKNVLSECQSISDLKWTVVRMYKEQADVVRQSAIKKIMVDTKKEISKSDWAKGKSEKQIQREIRIRSKELINAIADERMPGGWKQYLKNQFTLLKLLTESDDFVVPDVVAYEHAEEVVAPKDNFLFL